MNIIRLLVNLLCEKFMSKLYVICMNFLNKFNFFKGLVYSGLFFFFLLDY